MLKSSLSEWPNGAPTPFFGIDRTPPTTSELDARDERIARQLSEPPIEVTPPVELLARVIGCMAQGYYDVPDPERFELRDMYIVRGADANKCRRIAERVFAAMYTDPEQTLRDNDEERA